MDTWDISAQRAAASRARAEVVHALLARFAAWLRSAFASAPTISAAQARGRECFGTDC
jgi:hypothetical protein